MMVFVALCWILALCGCLLGSSGVHGACSEPLGVANAYITSTAPYNTGDRVYFRCYDGFTMSGTPSLECQSSGSFSGTYPTCTANDQAVTVKQSITSPNASSTGWMMLAFGSFIGLILLLLIIFALVFFYFMHRRQSEQRQQRWQRRVAFNSQRDSFRQTTSTTPSVAPSQTVIEEGAKVPPLNL